MNQKIISYVFKPILIGIIPAAFVCMVSELYLLPESVLLASLIAFALRHRMHIKAQELGNTPFTQEDVKEWGFTGFEELVNTYYKRGNIIVAGIITVVYILYWLIPETVSWFGVLATAVLTNIFFEGVVQAFLRNKKVPVPIHVVDAERLPKTKVFNAPLYAATGVVMFEDEK